MATPVIVVLILLGPVMGGLAFQVARERQNELHRDHLEDLLAYQAGDLRAKAQSVVETLYAMRSFFDCSEEVTRKEFAGYTRDARTRHPAIHVMEWIPRVTGKGRQAHEAQVARDGVTGYEIRERNGAGELVRAGPRDVYFPVCYAEPRAGNESALGYDVGSELSRRQALDDAASTCEAVLSEPLVLVQDPEAAPSVLRFLPVFDGDDDD